MRRLVILLVAVLALTAGLPGSAASAQTDPATAEADFVARINGLRAAKGLPALTVHAELTDVARAWAAEMAEADEISHNPDLAKQVRADWQKLGENVGVGMTVPKLHDAFVNSPAHYRNLVDPDFTHIGVAVVLGRDGAIFTAHQFMKLRTPKPAAATRDVPVEAAAAPTAVRQPSGRLVLVLEQLRELDVQ